MIFGAPSTFLLAFHFVLRAERLKSSFLNFRKLKFSRELSSFSFFLPFSFFASYFANYAEKCARKAGHAAVVIAGIDPVRPRRKVRLFCLPPFWWIFLRIGVLGMSFFGNVYVQEPIALALVDFASLNMMCSKKRQTPFGARVLPSNRSTFFPKKGLMLKMHHLPPKGFFLM